MRFPYVQLTSSAPVVSLDGRLSRPYPLIPVSLLGPATTVVRRGLLDTGADETVFPDQDAHRTGIDLSHAPTTVHSGIGGASFSVRYARMTLRVSDGQEFREWLAWIGFTTAPLKHPLLGFAGFLRFFTTTFHGDREEVELAINPLFPGPPALAAGP